MAFKIREYQKKTFTKAEFMQLTPGTHIVRFLEPTDDALLTESHFVVTKTGRFSVVCLGNDDCPLCKNNKKIYLEHPKDFRNQPDYFSKSDRYTLNILDRTPVKTCPSCKTEIKKAGTAFSATCPECSTMVVNELVHPTNRVKLLQLSKTLATQMNGIENATLGADGNPLGLTAFDIVFSVSMSGDKKVVTPIPATNNNDLVEVPKESFLDKNQGALHLTAEEIMDAISGVSLKDIFAARKSEVAVEAKEIVSDKEDEDIEERINKQLYSD